MSGWIIVRWVIVWDSNCPILFLAHQQVVKYACSLFRTSVPRNFSLSAHGQIKQTTN